MILFFLKKMYEVLRGQPGVQKSQPPPCPQRQQQNQTEVTFDMGLLHVTPTAFQSDSAE